MLVKVEWCARKHSGVGGAVTVSTSLQMTDRAHLFNVTRDRGGHIGTCTNQQHN
jgi:hypothetical protein